METDSPPGESKHYFKGAAGLIVAIAVVLVLLIALPAYRWFFLISVGIGVLVTGILRLWNRLKPVKEDNHNKRPLGLS